MDYPSISQINLKVKENAINVIFAVTAQQIGVYQKLANHVEGSTSATLSDDSSNVVELVKEEYSVSHMFWFLVCHRRCFTDNYFHFYVFHWNFRKFHHPLK